MLAQITKYLQQLQQEICHQITALEGQDLFITDIWEKDSRINGCTKIIENGKIFEKGGIGFSIVKGTQLPPAATLRHPELANNASFYAVGISLILHPRNPLAPTTHFNIRYFCGQPENSAPIWWFGGGYDLTPYYLFTDDCMHWHMQAQLACEPFGAEVYLKYKQWCDQYFYLPHRNETRGVGGLFFDDLNCWSLNKCFEFMQSIGNSFAKAYFPIVQRRMHLPYTAQQREFQLYRRGRYIEFNLLYDRGTLFGLQSNGRIESILMSLPPLASWKYNWTPEPNTPEAELVSALQQPRDWLALLAV
jgi:coproporphyrinogen III oxidase